MSYIGTALKSGGGLGRKGGGDANAGKGDADIGKAGKMPEFEHSQQCVIHAPS